MMMMMTITILYTTRTTPDEKHCTLVGTLGRLGGVLGSSWTGLGSVWESFWLLGYHCPCGGAGALSIALWGSRGSISDEKI